MNEKFEAIVVTKEGAHAAVMIAYTHAQTLLMNGAKVRIVVSEYDDSLTIRQLRFIHGPLFQQIAEQVKIDGVRYVKDVWKRHLKNLFIPIKFEMWRELVQDNETGKWRPAKRATPHRIMPSLNDLTGQARSEFIDKVIAHAVTEWGVEFLFDIDEREGVRYVRKARRLKQTEDA